MKFSTDGLVLKESYTGESDRIITVLTRDNGLVHAFASGARSLKSRNVSSTQLLCYSKFWFTESKGVTRVDSASSLDVFFGLRNDIAKLALAQYFCQIASAFTTESDESEEMLRLILNSLKFLETDKRPPLFLKATTELRICCISGYMPNLVACRECGKFDDDTYYFDMRSSDVLCSACAVKGTSSLKTMPFSVFSAMRHVAFSDFEKIFSYTADDESMRIMSDICEDYLLSKAERGFPTLDFYKTVT